ncbi:MAG: FGGY family carbohydrate kinase [Anaerolineae bacterium]|nr:FGGY family carbohydrate kinase [Anaerolineae bacterium]
MMLLGLDAGTTQFKAGLFDEGGQAVALARRAMPPATSQLGHAAYDPEALWQTACAAVREVLGAVTAGAIGAIGVASMAETGLLLDEAGRPHSPLLAWFDTAPSAQAASLPEAAGPGQRLAIGGIYPSFKCSLAKILWWRDTHGARFEGLRWLSVADYLAYRLCGVMATDYSLAGRTYAFRLSEAAWDGEWLERLGLPAELFPPARPAGTPLGVVRADAAAASGLPAGIPVAIGGHDHLCAAFAVGAVTPGVVFDSMGTAETLLGTMAPQLLGTAEQASGLTFGWHTARARYYWLGGLSTSGGAVAWLRGVLGEEALLDHEEVETLFAQSGSEPGCLLFLPYLAGSGAPRPDPEACAAFIGLSAADGRAELVRAVLEGTAYQMEAIRRAAEALGQGPIERIVVAGGGARSRSWLQVKADVTGCVHLVAAEVEAAAFGAALLAGLGGGLLAGEEEALAAAGQVAEVVEPDVARHEVYQRRYEKLFVPWQQLVLHGEEKEEGVDERVAVRDSWGD